MSTTTTTTATTTTNNNNNQSPVTTLLAKIEPSLPSWVDTAFALGTTGLLLAVIKLPWDMYFLARRTRLELEVSIKLENDAEKRITVQVEDEVYIRSVEKRLLAVCVGSHVVTAVAIYGIAKLTNEQYIKEHTSLLFLGSALVRPLVSAHKYMKTRLQELMNKVKYPREDINQLRQELRSVQNEVQDLTYRNTMLNEQQERLKERANSLDSEVSRNRELIKDQRERLTSVANKFEETVTKISKDQVMLAGVKEFIQSVIMQNGN